MPTPAFTETRGTRSAWTVACADGGMDCPFQLTDHDRKELAYLAIQHVRNIHGKSLSEAEIFGMARPSNW